jgi:hypothetical protein
VHGAQDFEGPLRIGNRRIQERGLIGSTLPLGIAWAGVPCRWNDYLIVHNLLVFDFNPMPQGTARRLMKSKALAGLGPAVRTPFVPIVEAHVAVCHVVVKLRNPIGEPADHDVRFKSPGGDAAQRREESGSRKLEFSERTVDQCFHLLIAGGIGDQCSCASGPVSIGLSL